MVFYSIGYMLIVRPETAIAAALAADCATKEAGAFAVKVTVCSLLTSFPDSLTQALNVLVLSL